MTYYDYFPKRTSTTRVQRMRARENAGRHTLFFKAPGFGKSGLFLRPEDVPEFDGEEAIFEYEKAGRGRIRLLRLVEVTKR
jgi:hypothetical protein